MRLVEMKFADQKGFNYLKFLDQLQPSEKLENKYQTRMTQLMSKKDQVSILIILDNSTTLFTVEPLC